MFVWTDGKSMGHYPLWVRCPKGFIYHIVVLLKMLYAACVPNLTYSCEAICYNSRQFGAMDVALNDAIRRIFGYDRWESVRHLRSTHGYPSLTEIFPVVQRILLSSCVQLTTPLCALFFWFYNSFLLLVAMLFVWHCCSLLTK